MERATQEEAARTLLELNTGNNTNNSILTSEIGLKQSPPSKISGTWRTGLVR